MPTYSVTLETDQPRAEDLSAELWEHGASGVEVRDGEGTPMPGLPVPPPGRAILVAWFADLDAAGAAAAALGGAVAEVPDEDWGETWKKGLGPMTIGRVFVRPSWVDAPVPAGLAEVVLDPGMAFGTGTHPTTSLCLAALSDLLAARPGASVLDVGTGSGLLAIAARKLGAGRVAGNDNDPVAVDVARENAERNGASLELTVAPLPAIRGPFDLVVANILANTLVELAPQLAAQLAPGGVVLLSGILAPQADEVRAAYVAQGLAPVPGGDRLEGEWALLALGKKHA
ncbi:50S ribosomal protein L11 methyltransferase [Anaeromyxobacter oryzae]|uniref:50S ribosomal protein L11 methyltransferase n=1 Tax=Anaeromyxobacter oryzae TaxID=2918170 RepID=UPI00202B85CC|nr:50S ribosomal protein L11 methyltransferase [Anaeromyxobacter oryzae]